MKSCALLALLLAGLAVGTASAQVRTVTGTVTSADDGTALPGVNVRLGGTTVGTSTDADGEYMLVLPGPGGTLEFSFVGFVTTTVEVGDRRTVDVALALSVEALNDVVVVGYGSEERARLASATSTVEAADIANTPVAGVDAAIQGRAAGVQVIQNSGTPGTGITVRVRGHSSVEASNQPLYVVDGVPMLSDNYSQLGYGGQDITGVTNLSPSDIESVDILKDASATAIYGSRGANGVVLITTRRGRSGRPTITYDAYTGTQNVIRTLDLMNAREYVTYMNEAATNDDSTDVFAYGNPDSLTADTDWQSEVFRSAPIQSHSLSISGGDLRTRYYVSGSYFDQGGIVIGSGYDRASVRANLDLTANSRLNVSSSLGLSRESNLRIENDDTIRGVLSNAIANQPHIPVLNDDGTFTGTDDGLAYINGVAVGTLNSGESLTYRALANVHADYRIAEGFLLNARAGADVLSMRENRYRSPLVGGDYAEQVGGIAISGYDLATRYLAEAFATYNRTFGRHAVSATGGGSMETNE
ncbi:MAG TPA: SusC/RagA family TonB-linked outer membrane protein, partial [Rhodothermales bacterium]|nr:SusC/RagA family TonB-linked outer membrane protein [Rhodothermales bacterium]